MTHPITKRQCSKKQQTPSKITSKTVETELYWVISACLTRMQYRRLDSTPSSKNIPLTTEVMTEDLIKDGYGDKDCERIAQAIDAAGRNLSRFPAAFHVKQFIKTKSQIEFEKEKPKKQISYAEASKERKRSILVEEKAMAEINRILKKRTGLDLDIEKENMRHKEIADTFIKKHGKNTETAIIQNR